MRRVWPIWDFDIVRVQISGQDRVKLQIMVERQGGGEVNVDDCASVSRSVSALLDVADPLRGAYTLEVSSPGIDRPLTRLADFERYAGFEARIEMTIPIEGRRRFRGRLLGLDGRTICLALEEGEDAKVRLDFEDMMKAKLVLTDDLIAAHSRAPA